MAKVLFDTDICIYLIKQQFPKIRKRLNKYVPGDVAISAITWSELQYGIENSERKAQALAALEEFVIPFDILPFDENAAAQTARVRAILKKNGTPIGPYDTMIAGHALALGIPLVTNNEREFDRVPKLKTENWTK